MRIANPLALVEVAIAPTTTSDQTELGRALLLIATEDPSFSFSTDPHSGQTIIGGIDDRHIAAILDRMRLELAAEPAVSSPHVAYRETITDAVDVDYTYKKQVGSHGDFARVILRLEPAPHETGFEFACNAPPGNFPARYLPSVERAVAAAAASGVVAGFPVIGCRVVLADGAHHDSDSNAEAFEQATRIGLAEGLRRGDPVLLEPIMRVEIAATDRVQDVVADLLARGGVALDDQAGADIGAIRALVPLARMFGYAAALEAMTQGPTSWSMRFEKYAPVQMPASDDPVFPGAAAVRVA